MFPALPSVLFQYALELTTMGSRRLQTGTQTLTGNHQSGVANPWIGPHGRLRQTR